MSSPRELAIKAVGLVLKGPGRPKDVLQSLLDGMERRDRGFVMELCYGVLRHRDMLDLVLGWLMERPGGVPQKTLNNLRAGVYQIFFMRVPEWAAVNEAVELESRHRGLVNGVLRNAIRKLDEFNTRLEAMAVDASSDEPSRAVPAISTLTSHPLWLIKRWAKRLGTEEAYALALSNNKVPPLTLRVNSTQATREEVMTFLRHKGIACEPTAISPHGIMVEGTLPFDGLGLGGLALVQDEAAQLVSLMLAPEPGMRVLDACAAPGGKTTHLAQMVADSGEVIALDIDGARLERLMENLQALELASKVKVVQADLLKFTDPDGFDAVLLDAPCTATGVIRRNPDIKYRRKRSDLKKYAATQYELLMAASRLVRPGGRLVYAVCSTEPEEGEMVVERFLKSCADFYIIVDVPFLPAELCQGGAMRTWPHRDGMDGFYSIAIARSK